MNSTVTKLIEIYSIYSIYSIWFGEITFKEADKWPKLSSWDTVGQEKVVRERCESLIWFAAAAATEWTSWQWQRQLPLWKSFYYWIKQLPIQLPQVTIFYFVLYTRMPPEWVCMQVRYPLKWKLKCPVCLGTLKIVNDCQKISKFSRGLYCVCRFSSRERERKNVEKVCTQFFSKMLHTCKVYVCGICVCVRSFVRAYTYVDVFILSCSVFSVKC